MLKQMLARDLDAQKVMHAKEKNRGVYRVHLGLSNENLSYIKLLRHLLPRSPDIKVFCHFSLVGRTSSILRTFLGGTSEKTPST